MTPRFAQLVNPYFSQVLELAERMRRREPVELERERDALIEELDLIATEVSNDRTIRDEHFALAKPALIYWTDEILTQADPDWKEMTLEMRVLGSRDRAWLFYKDGHTQALGSHPDVLEVYYLALALNFRGDIEEAFRFHLNYDNLPGNVDDPEAARQAWAKELESRLQATARTEPTASESGGALVDLPGHRRLPKAIAAVVAAAMLVVGLGLFMRFVIHAEPESQTAPAADWYEDETY